MPRNETELPKTEAPVGTPEVSSGSPEKGEKNPVGEWMRQKFVALDTKVTEWLEKQEDPEKTARACKYAANALGILTVAGTQIAAIAGGRPEHATWGDLAVRTAEVGLGAGLGIGESLVGGGYFQLKETQFAEKKAAANAAGEGYTYEI